jgi:transcriptional regulator with XRE-family HTH domain
MDDVGLIIARWRKRKNLGQEELAAAAGVSQATISRVEKQEQTANIKTLAKIARALGVGLSELVPAESLNSDGDDADSFYAFCENPLCARNKLKLENGNPSVFWESWQQYRNAAWSEANFCRTCGTELMKECRSCNKRFLEKGGRFCTRCGTENTTRPSEKEWEAIRARLGIGKTEEFDDDIPF